MIRQLKACYASVTRFLLTTRQLTRVAWNAYPGGLVLILILNLVQGLVPLGAAWIAKLLFDELAVVLGISMSGGPPAASTLLSSKIIWLLVAQTVLTILTQSLSPVASYFSSELARRVSLDVQTSVYRKVNSLTGLTYFEDPHFYDVIQLATQGAQRGPTHAVNVMIVLLRSIITIVAFLGVLISLSPLMTAVLFIISLPQLYVNVRIGHQHISTVLNSTPRERSASYFGSLLVGLAHAKEVRLFGLAEHFLQRFIDVRSEINVLHKRQHAREVRSQIMLYSLSSLITASAFALIVLLAFQRHLSLGDIMLYTGAVTSVQTALSSLHFAVGNIHESVMFYGHYSKLMELPEEPTLSRPSNPVPHLTYGIEFRNVSFRYSPEQPWVLRRANFFIPAGKRLALVGLNGAGKTTLVKLLTRLYDPSEGEILWDGIDLTTFNPQQLRQHLATIFQDFVHYELTVHENIGLGNLSKLNDDVSVHNAAVKAGIHSKIEGLPARYQTTLSRWLVADLPGTDLSGGEWQKLALARMLMRDAEADLFILDEPTSALDAQAEYDIYTRFTRLMSTRTSLLITHRFSTVRIADIVAVLEDGQITEYGTHESLLTLGKTYAKLYKMQTDRYR